MSKEMGKASFFLLGVALLLIVLPGFLASAAPAQPQVAVYAYSTDVTVFWDPSDSFSDEIIWMNNVYQTLLRYEPFKDSFEPVLATSFEKSTDGLTWTFHLRKGVKFHTGDEMDAAAVKASIERTISRGKSATYIWDAVKSIDAIGKYTVVFHLKYPAALDLTVSAGYAAFIFDPKFSDHDWFKEGHDSGTGPYMVESHKGNTEIILTKFDGYWGGWNGKHFDKIAFEDVPEASTRMLMVESGTADFTNRLPVTDIKALQGNPNVRIVHTPSFQNLLALFNTQKPPLNNRLVREALAYAIPYKGILEGVLGGYGRQSRGVIPYGLWGYSDRIRQYTLSIPTAKLLLKAAGYPNGGFKLILTYASGDENESRVAQLWKSELAKLGVDLEARGMPWGSQWSLAKSPDPNARQDIFLMYWWPDYADPHSFLSAMFESEKTINFNLDYYSNPLFDNLVNGAAAIAGIDREGAINMYVAAQNVLMEDMPGLAIYDMEYLRATRASLKGYVDNPAYPHVVFWYNCYRE